MDIGHGTQFLRETDTPGTYAATGEVFEVTAPSITKDVVDATHMQSPDRFKEYIGGLVDVGEFSVTLKFEADDPNIDDLIADVTAKAARNYKIIFPDDTSTEWIVSGLATKYEPGVPMGDKMTANFTVKPTGKPAFIA